MKPGLTEPDLHLKPFRKRHILDYSKQKDFADDKFKFDEMDRKYSNCGNEKTLLTSNFSFSHSVFKKLVLQTRKKIGLVWEGFKTLHQTTKFLINPNGKNLQTTE